MHPQIQRKWKIGAIASGWLVTEDLFNQATTYGGDMKIKHLSGPNKRQMATPRESAD